MILKPEDAIASAMSKAYKGLKNERKEQLLATLRAANNPVVRATHPEKLAELQAHFAEHLSEPEKHFIADIAEGFDPSAAPAVTAPEAAPNAGGMNGSN